MNRLIAHCGLLVCFVSSLVLAGCDQTEDYHEPSGLYGPCSSEDECQHNLTCVAGTCTKTCSVSDGQPGQCLDSYKCSSGCCSIATSGSGYCVPYAPTVPELPGPQVVLAAPVDGERVTGATTIIALVYADSGVEEVTFYVDGVTVGKDSSPPYECAAGFGQYPPGTVHSIVVSATDGAGNVGLSDTVTVVVTETQTGSSDITPPVVVVTYPPDGAGVADTVPVKAAAEDLSGIDVVTFYVDGNALYTDSSKPYEYPVDFGQYPPGTVHSIMVSATDGAGNVGLSQPVFVIRQDCGFQVQLTSPVNDEVIHVGNVFDVCVSIFGLPIPPNGPAVYIWFVDWEKAVLDNVAAVDTAMCGGFGSWDAGEYSFYAEVWANGCTVTSEIVTVTLVDW